jgi:quercetin dioxygenase-like cupin family protein
MANLITLAKDAPLQDRREGLRKRSIVASPNVAVDEFFFERGVATQDHSHAKEQAAYVVAGKFQIEIDGKTAALGPGDGYSIPADQEHKVVCLEEGSYILATLQSDHGHGHGHGHGHDH